MKFLLYNAYRDSKKQCSLIFFAMSFLRKVSMKTYHFCPFAYIAAFSTDCLTLVRGTSCRCCSVCFIASLYFAEQNRLFVYPNPVRQSEFFTVIFNEQQSGEFQLIDVNGRVLQRYVIENGGAIQISANRLPAGLYLLRLARNNLKVRIGRIFVY
jgi:hypothetical protein